MSDAISLPTNGIFVSARGAKSKRRWNPKEWRPEYTAIVAVSCTGLSNEEVGRQFGYTKEHISNILCTEQAVKLRQLINKRLLDSANSSQTERLDRLRDVAMRRIETVLMDDDRAVSNPLQIFDRSFKFLQATRDLAPEREGASGSSQTNIQNNFVLGDSAASALSQGITAALNIADKFKEIPSDSIEPKKLAG